MNKFMGGLTLGIILTSAFFIFFHPFQKKAFSPTATSTQITIDSLRVQDTTGKSRAAILPYPATILINQKVNRDSLILFAKSLIGTPYLYGSADPARGFDCSGFITYVFNHFKIAVPRSSYDFANIGTKAALNTCLPGDVILFTGTNSLERTIGHIGIVCEIANGIPSFIHSSSGRIQGVTITSMDNKFYKERFVSVINLL